MILIFGGTTEGRRAASVCDEAAKPFYYSTKSNMQKVQIANGIQINGDLDERAMAAFCQEKKICLIIDAAHPFAEQLHWHIATVSEQLEIPVIRYERTYPERDNSLCWFDSYADSIDYLKQNNINNLLALTGVNTISKFKPYWQKYECWFRILDREESRSIISKERFPVEKVLYYKQGEDEFSLFKQIAPQAIITKESGESGGFNEKIAAAKQLNIPVLVIKRPKLSPLFIPVYGENGLRKEIEKLLPTFFELKTGYTTGTCATVATKGALMALLTGKEQNVAEITLPNGELISMAIHSTSLSKERVSCSVIKDAGDDPDVTNGLEIVSSVQFNSLHKEIRFIHGDGVGLVTLPGLGIEIGAPAINKTPRQMMEREVSKLMQQYLKEAVGVDITISVPNGKEIAKKTFNPKLGIVGGISIIGTSGVVKPFSSDAFIASIRKEMQVAKALNCRHIIINSGAKSEQFVKLHYPNLRSQAFIQYGNFIGEAIRNASELGFEKLTLCIMIGKAVKLAQGSLDTHSKKRLMNKEFIYKMAQEAGCAQETLERIISIKMARELWSVVPESEQSFFSYILRYCYKVCSPLFANGELEILLIDEEGGVFN